MSKPTLPTPSQPLSDAASHLVHRVSELVCRLSNLEDEETRLDAQTRLFNERLQKAKANPPASPIQHTFPIPAVRSGVPVTERADGGESQTTPPHIDPKNIETPVKTFLLMESFALATSVKSKRKGRIFLTGDTTEFGERRQAIEAVRNFP